MLAGVGLLGIVLSLGPSGGLFSLLFRMFPPYQGLRVPSRAGILFLLAVAVLAAYGLARIRQKRLRMVLFVVVAAECYAGPLPWSFEVPKLPPIYQHLADATEPGAWSSFPFPTPTTFRTTPVTSTGPSSTGDLSSTATADSSRRATVRRFECS